MRVIDERGLVWDESSYLSHHGIQGQKWGKKNGPPYPLGASDHSAAEKKAGWRKSLDKDGNSKYTGKKSRLSFSLDTFSTSDGRLIIEKHKNSAFAKFMAKHNKSAADVISNNFDYSIKNKSGDKIGYLSLTKESSDELNVNWISIKSKQRGNKYAQSVMNTVVDMAKENDFKAITLEVPGDSKDARHIYEKMGFKEVRKISSDDIWEGLTKMKLTLNANKESVGINEGRVKAMQRAGMTYEQIAKKLGISESSVGHYLNS